MHSPSKSLALLLVLVSSAARAATVRGRVTVDNAGHPVGAAHVALVLEGGPEPAGPAAGVARLDERWLSFLPKVQVVAPGSTLVLVNHDEESHTVHARQRGATLFDLATIPRGVEQRVRLDRTGLVKVSCDIHAEMSALIVVTRHAHFAVTDEAGGFVIEGVPPGRHAIRAVWPRMDPGGEARSTVAAGEPHDADAPGVVLATVDVMEGGAPVALRLPSVGSIELPEVSRAPAARADSGKNQLPSWLLALVPARSWPRGPWALALGALALFAGMGLALGNLALADARGRSRMGAVLGGCGLTLLCAATILAGLHAGVAIALGFGCFIGTVIFAADDAPLVQRKHARGEPPVA